MPSKVEIDAVVLGKKVFKKFCQSNFARQVPYPLAKEQDPSIEKKDFPSSEDALCQVWLEMALWFLRRRFLNFVNVFSLFRYNYHPLEKTGPFI